MGINNIVFDLGGVLVDWNPRHLYRKIFDGEDEMESFLENICSGEWNSRQDEGRSLQEATELLLSQYPEFTAEITAYYDRWTEMLNGHIEGTVDILKHLKSNTDYRLLALSNWSGETFPTALEIFDFLHWFEGIVVSGDEGLIKPDHKIYQVLFERYQIKPQESVFIDDSLKNVHAAKELGMAGIHFRDPHQLAENLQGLDVL